VLSGSSLVAASALSAVGLTSPAQAQQPATAPATAGQKPNIVVVMGDDIGWFNIGAYHQGIMSGKTPNLDKLAAEGMRSPTTMLRRPVPPAAPTSSRASYRSALA
jgi:hypothetical protein